MKYAGMAKHDISTFNEGSATRFLAEYLEQKNTIKTFFKENDRTPNYDGTFEIVTAEGFPMKQFIVQIKKVENLTPNIQGQNKGNYMYEMETKFLAYVKAKVTESPAIYFVVDIAAKRIFWLYLSDELLMNLNFEGHEKIRFPFQESDIIGDFDVFMDTLNQITSKRNTLFLDKTPEEIASMQEALDYINGLMDNDFSKIKDSIFPNLWRFGIKHSNSEDFSITAGDKTVRYENTAMFALYPQMKGVADTGLREYSMLGEQYFNQWDATGKTTPMEYTKNSLHKIIKTYFENGISIQLLPNLILMERLNWFVTKMTRFYTYHVDDQGITINELYRSFCILAKYIQHIVADASLSENESTIKHQLVSAYYRGRIKNFCIFDYLSLVQTEFEQHCNFYKDIGDIRFSLDLFELFSKNLIESRLIMLELQKRRVETYKAVWNYDYFELSQQSPEEFLKCIDSICQQWFSQLPVIYNQVYEAMFEKHKYRVTGRFEYQNEYRSDRLFGADFSTVICKYENTNFEIEYNSGCRSNYDNPVFENGLLSKFDGYTLSQFFPRKHLFYDAVRCLLYQGICNELNFDHRGLSIGSQSLSLFD